MQVFAVIFLKVDQLNVANIFLGILRQKSCGRCWENCAAIFRTN